MITGISTEAVTEEGASTLNATGSLTVTDTDSGEASFTASTVTGSYGSLTIDASGSWSYEADNSQTAIQSLGSGDTLTETLSIQSFDGTTQNIVLTINGTNDAAVISGTSTGAVTENDASTLLTTGSLSVSDTDAGEASFSVATVTGSYGSLTIDASGNWSYEADNSQTAVQALGGSNTLTETLSVQSFDGTTENIVITINGLNNAAVISGTTTGAISEDGASTLNISGALTITDTDTGEDVFTAATVTGSYGSLTIDASGSWSYEADNSQTAIQSLGSGDTLTETLSIQSFDGTTQNIVITINGTNDAAVISGVTTGAVIEDGASTLNITGSLSVTDADSGEASFSADTVTGSYGSLTINASGSWSYDADNSQTAIQSLGYGDTLTETLTIQSVDGTTQNIMIIISGVNDAAVISGTTTGAVTEDGASTLNTTGSLSVTDTDSGEASFTANTVMGSYGSLTIDTSGSWSYDADNSQTAIQALGSGDTLTETIEITSADGTAYDIVITLNGINDAASISGTDTGAVTEDGASTLTTSGNLSVTDSDSGEADFTAATVTGTYGSLTIDASGSWSYDADNSQTVIQALGSGDTLTETLSVQTADGTTQNIVITINGTNDTAVISGTTTGAVTEDGASTLTTLTDSDSGEAVYTVTGYLWFPDYPSGSWSYDADNSQTVIQALGSGDTLTETLSVQTADGTTQNIVITINGTNDAATFSGTSTGAVTEDAASTLTATGSLNVSDTDSGEASFTAATVTGSYGSLTIDASGSWSYDADNSQTAIQALGSGDTLTETIEITSADGTAYDIVITLNGINDAASISGTDTGAVTEDGASTLTTSGSLSVTDSDSGEANFTAATVTGTYGSLTIDASGSWSYDADNSQTVIQALGSGDTLTETLSVQTADGTTQNIVITINGTNDAATFSGTSTGAVTEDAASTLTATGSLNVSDTDSGEASFTAATVTGSYGSLTIDASGSWSYDADNSQTAIQALGSGDTLTETIEITSADGTAYDIVITLNGINDAASISGTDTGAVTEDGASTLTTSGSLSVTDSDSGEANFTAATVTGTYGSLTIDASGSWSYDADNSQSAIQALGPGDTLTETLSVQAADGSTQNIVITISGVNDAPDAGAAITATANEDNTFTLTSAQLLANATDAEGDTLSVTSLTTTSSNVTIVDNGDNTWTITPDPDWAGTATLSYVISDGTTTTTGTVNATINAVADTPQLFVSAILQAEAPGTVTAAQDFSSASEGITIDLASDEAQIVATGATSQVYNVTNVTGSSHDDTFSFSNPSNGDTYTINGGGGTNILDLSNFAASDVNLSETSAVISLSDTESFTINYSNIDSIRFDSSTTDGDPHEISFAGDGDWTAEGTNLSVRNLGDGEVGIALIDYEGTLSENFTLSVDVTAHAATGNMWENGFIIFDYQDENNYKYVRAHVQADQWSIRSVVEGTEIHHASFAQVLEADTEVTLTMRATGGLVEILGPDGDDADSDPDVIVSHNFGADVTLNGGQVGVAAKYSDTDFDIRLQPSNWAPDVADYDLELDISNTSITTANVLADATDVEGETLSISAFTNGTNGTVTNNGDGTFTYTPNANFTGIDTFTYTISDGTNTTTGTIRVVVTDSQNINIVSGSGSPVDIDISAALTDTDGSETLSITLSGIADGVTISDGSNSFTATSSDSSVTVTSWDLDSIVLTPPTINEVDFDLTVTAVSTDGTDTATNTSTVSFVYIANTAASFSGTDAGTATEDSASTLIVSGTLSVTDTDPGQGSFNAETITGSYGSLTIDASGSWSYNADNSQNVIQSLGSGDTLTETIEIESDDGTTHDIIITINGVNDAASISGTDTGSVTEDAASTLTATGTLSVTDTDSGESSFTAQTITGSYGTLTINASGSWTYSAADSNAAIQGLDSGGSLTDTIQIQSADGTTHDIVITINGNNNDAPDAGAAITASANEDNTFTLSSSQLLANATDPEGNTLSVTSLTTTSSNVTIVDNGDNTWTITPDPDWSGTAALSYVISDGTNTTTGTVNATINAVADTPQLSVSAVLQADAPTTITAAQDFSSATEGVTIDLVSSETQVVVTGSTPQIYNVTNVTGSSHDDTFSFSSPTNGTTYTINGGTGTNILDLSNFEASDVSLTETSATVTLSATESFTINYSNIASVRFDNSTTNGDPHQITFGNGDWTANGTSLSVRNLPTTSDRGIALIDYAGTLSENFTLSTTVHAHETSQYENGFIVFDYQDANNYKLVRAFIQADRWGIRHVVNGVESELASLNDILEADTDLTLSMRATGGLVEILDPDDDSIVLVSHDFGDSVSLNSGRVGVGAHHSDTDFTINLQPDNWAPDVADYNLELDISNTSLTTANVLAAAIDEEGDSLSISAFTQGTNGTVTNNGDGTFTYTPNANFTGIDTFTYTISDGTNTTTGTVRVVVTDALNIELEHGEGDPVNIDISSSLTDTDGSETLAVTLSGIANGVTITDGTNSFTATATNNSVVVTSWTLSSLTLTPPTTGEENFDLLVTATSTDGTSTSSNTSTIHFNYKTTGTDNAETLTGNSADNIIYGQAGNDIVGGATGDDTLYGGAGNDDIRGGQGSDTLFGGTGDDILRAGPDGDTMTGGEGSDTFYWASNHVGTASNPTIDVITDFTTGSGGDVLDIGDILTGEDDTASSLENYLSFSVEDGNTTIDISTTSGGDVVQKITLEGVDLSSLGATDAAIITTLLNDGNLSVDSS